MHRFFSLIRQKNILIILHQDAFHISQVIKLVKNDYLEIVFKKQLFLTQIMTISKTKITSKIIKIIPENNELPVKITLLMGLVANKKMAFIIQKAVELGVTKIIPVQMKRSKMQEKKK